MELLATLKIYRDDSGGKETSYSRHKPGTSEYEIVLRPKADAMVSKYGNQTVDVLAHELGHFVGNFAKTPTAKKSGFWWTTTNQELESEKEAWRIARDIKPDISQEIEKDAVGAYEKLAKTMPNTPMLFTQ